MEKLRKKLFIELIMENYKISGIKLMKNSFIDFKGIKNQCKDSLIHTKKF